uniref:Cadherin, putative n=1 Tax=Schistosoma mansoni TaxID=6183 RepID=A0A3Q0KHC0_SCHMA
MESYFENDKTMLISYRIQEELPSGTLVGNLFNDVRKLYEKFKFTTSSPLATRITTLHSIKQLRKFELNPYDLNSKQMNEYFKLDQQTGDLFTQNRIDYEYICPKPLVHTTTSSMMTSYSSSALSSSSKTLSTIHSNNHGLVHLPHYDCLIQLILFVSLKNSTDERWIPIRIYIEDINDNRPKFIEFNSSKWFDYFNVTIKENIPLGTRIPLMKAYDLDTIETNTNILYKLNYPIKDNQTDYHRIFGLVTCSISKYHDNNNNHRLKDESIHGRNDDHTPCLIIKDKLDYEMKQYYSIELIACESGYSTPTDCAILPIKITIIDMNDNIPKFIFPIENYYSMNVSENLPIGTLLLKVEAIDMDSGENSRLTYSLTQNSFRKKLIPTEIHDHDLSDSNHNDNDNLRDDTDYDQSNLPDQFIINPYNGEIRLNQLLHAHETKQIEITIHVNDNGIPMHKISKHLLFNIIDINNHAPKIQIKKVGCNKFDIESNEIKISETIESGSYIGFIIVSDLDLGENGQVTCDQKLEDYNDNHNWGKYSHFKINLINNGQISSQYLYTLQVIRGDHLSNDKNDLFSSKINNTLDYRTIFTQKLTSFMIIITCKDHGSPSALTTSINLLITVTDYQQIDLCFEQITYELIIEESNQPILNLLRPQLLDIINKVKFSIQPKNEKYKIGCDRLEIDSFTGEISAPNGIDREEISYFICLLIAKESDNNNLTKQNRIATTELIINITDINDNEPKLNKDILLYGFTINEWDEYLGNENDQMNQTNSYIIGFLNAIDLDFGLNGTIKYTLAQITTEKYISSINKTRQFFNQNNDDHDKLRSLFQIDSTSGLISLSRSKHYLIDREQVTTYHLQIILEDMGYPIKLTSIQTIQIYVTDVNDNAPRWHDVVESTNIQLYPYNKEITIYQLEPIWEINQNSPIELRSQLKVYDLDFGDNAKLQMYIIEPNHEYQQLIGRNQFNLPIDSLYLSINGELKLYIDKLEEIYQYYTFIRVQDQGIHRQLYTDGYFFIQLPIKTINKLEVSMDSLNITDRNTHLMNISHLATNNQSTWLWLNEFKVIIVLIISFSLIIILSIIMIFVILIKFQKKKRKKLRKTYFHQIIDHIIGKKHDTFNSDYYTTNISNNSSSSNHNTISNKNDYYKYNPMNLTYQSDLMNQQQQHLTLNTNPFNVTSISSNLYPQNNNHIDSQYSHEHVHVNEFDNSCVDSMFQRISAPYDLFYPTIYTNLMTSYENTIINTTTTTTSTTNMNSSSTNRNYQYFNNTLHY